MTCPRLSQTPSTAPQTTLDSNPPQDMCKVSAESGTVAEPQSP